MEYKLYEFEDLDAYMQNKIVNKTLKMLKKNKPDVIAKDPYYVEHNKKALSSFLYNKSGRPICTKEVYEGGKI